MNSCAVCELPIVRPATIQGGVWKPMDDTHTIVFFFFFWTRRSVSLRVMKGGSISRRATA